MVTIENLKKIIQKSAEEAKNAERSERIPESPNPRMLSKWYEDEVKWANNQIDEIEKNMCIKCSCEKGCNYCCNQPIAISTSEALAIKPYITNMNSTNREVLIKKVNKICNEIMESGIEVDVNIFRGVESIDNYLKEYFQLNIQCPLLDGEGLCSIYSVRPGNCWSYRVYEESQSCKISHNVNHSIKYDDWEKKVLERLFKAKKPKRTGLKLLPFVIKDILEGKL